MGGSSLHHSAPPPRALRLGAVTGREEGGKEAAERGRRRDLSPEGVQAISPPIAKLRKRQWDYTTISPSHLSYMALCWCPEETSSATREAVTGSKDLGLYHDCAQLGEELPAHSGDEGHAC